MAGGHINGQSRDAYLEKATDPIARAKTDWDIMEYIADQIVETRKMLPKKYITRWEAKLGLAGMLVILLAWEKIPLAKVWGFIF